MTVQCKRVFTCAKLARQKKCSWAFKKALNINCKRPLTRWQQNGLVKNSCRRSCRNCVGTFLWFWNTLNFLQYVKYKYLKKLFFKLTTLSSNCLLTAPNADIEPYLKETMQSQVGKYLSTRGKLNWQYYICLWNKIKFFTRGIINMYMLYGNIKAKDPKREKMERRHARPLEILNAIPLLGTIIQMPAVRIKKNVA